MANGPDTSLELCWKFPTIRVSPVATVLNIDPNCAAASFAAAGTLSAVFLSTRLLFTSCTPMRPYPSSASSGTRRSTLLSDPRRISNSITLPSDFLMSFTSRSTSSLAVPIATSFTFRMTSPDVIPFRSATPARTTSGTLMPGSSCWLATPTVVTWVNRIEYANTKFAMTPALMTIARSKSGRFLSKFGSSGSMSLSGSSSGNATKPPRGKALSEYSTCGP
mmetsp:Transcript_47575/g.119089  ORF Transcript_47575/g.119089 Transcript_47575/m.119089 type:complete len:221 (-) Transcript_47575:625-1287(-)